MSRRITATRTTMTMAQAGNGSSSSVSVACRPPCVTLSWIVWPVTRDVPELGSVLDVVLGKELLSAGWVTTVLFKQDVVVDVFLVVLTTGLGVSVAAAVLSGLSVDFLGDVVVSVSALVLLGCAVDFSEPFVVSSVVNVVFWRVSVAFVRVSVISLWADVVLSSCSVGAPWVPVSP